MGNLRDRDLLTLRNYTTNDIRFLIDLAKTLKVNKLAGNETQFLKEKNIVLIFEKKSTRTRCAFEVAMFDQGGNVSYIDSSSSQLSHKESLKDTARVLSQIYDGIGYRGFQHSNVEELAQYSNVPVWNALTNEYHPTQILADFLTMEESANKPLEKLAFCYLGDARFNIGNSLLIGGVKMGMDVRIAAPESLWPKNNLIEEMTKLSKQTGATITLETDPFIAVRDVDFIYTDVWVSMGEPITVWEERINQLIKYQVNSKLMIATGNPHIKFMHCLPALHNVETELGQMLCKEYGLAEFEVSEEVFESATSIVFAQAQNKMHTIKAVLVATLI